MKVLYFAWLRQKIGHGEEVISPPADVATAGALVDWLVAKGGGYPAAFADKASVKVAINQDFARMDDPIGPEDEVAFFPPVTGG